MTGMQWHTDGAQKSLLVKIISHSIDLSGMGDADNKIGDHPPRNFLASYILVRDPLSQCLRGLAHRSVHLYVYHTH